VPAKARAATGARTAKRPAADSRAGPSARRPGTPRARTKARSPQAAVAIAQRLADALAADEASAPAGLVYVSDDRPGIRRIRQGDAFVYKRPDGKPVRSESELRRIRKLAIPPAYEDVWICTDPRGHLQATGRDARGRKQYRYHPEWREARDADKFERMLEFGAALPRIRRRVAADLAAPVGAQPGRNAVLATLVRLLDTTYVRVGNDEYARENHSYGLTTLRNRHAEVSGGRLQLRFRGKSGKLHEVSLEDPRVARVVRRCQAMPGQELFQYEDENGETRVVDSADVNAYIREASGASFSAKDFRTWHGTVHALMLWAEQMAVDAANRLSANEVLKQVAHRLGNTVAVCRKSYVHPRVLEVLAARAADEAERLRAKAPLRRPGLTAGERQLLAFLSEAA
jgi:DNA topoisomerase-1